MKTHSAKLKAKDGSAIYFQHWAPEIGPVKGTIILIHGMAEHAQRYAHVAQYFCTQQYQVFAPDLRGHGQTGEASGQMGQFAASDGWRKGVSDILLLIKQLRHQYPNTKLFLLGHSMGSYFAQHCAMVLSGKLSGMILSASSIEYHASLAPGLFVTRVARLIGLGKRPAGWLQRMIFNGYNKVFVPNRTAYDWLASDSKVVDAYIADPLCGFTCSYSFFYDLFWGIWHLTPETIRSIKPTLPILLISGAQDPMGKMGHRVTKLAKIYRDHNFESVEVKLYARSRHESLNDQEKDEVMRDIMVWIAAHSS